MKLTTIHPYLDIMKRAFNIPIWERKWYKAEPVTRVSLERLNNKRDRWLTLEEEKKIPQVSPEWLKEIAIFALNTGMRLGEILSLTWKGVDLFRKTLTVFKSKNSERRTILLNVAVYEIFKNKSEVRSIKTDLVFHSEVHTSFTQRNIEEAFHAVMKKAEIEDFRFQNEAEFRRIRKKSSVNAELASIAVETAFERHVGRIEITYGPKGEILMQVGKDLS